MKYDRFQLKASARALVRQAEPKPWLVTFIVWFLAADLSALCLLIYLAAGVFSGTGKISPPLLILAVIATTGLILFLFLLRAGQHGYALRLWRTGKGGPMDLTQGIFFSAQVLELYGQLLLRLLAWALPGAAAVCLTVFLAGLSGSPVVTGACAAAVGAGALALLLNHLLPYALAPYILMDDPSVPAQDILKRSKRLMIGRRMDLLLLLLSFLGWVLLACSLVCLSLLPGLLIQSASALTVLPDLPGWFLVPFAAVGCAAAFPLLLWLSSYAGAASAGFYDIACAPPFSGVTPGGKRLK